MNSPFLSVLSLLAPFLGALVLGLRLFFLRDKTRRSPAPPSPADAAGPSQSAGVAEHSREGESSSVVYTLDVPLHYLVGALGEIIGPLRVRITKLWLQRLLLASGIVVCLLFPAVRTYADFFPRRLSVQALFDDDGISAALQEINVKVISNMRIATDWRQRKRLYFERLNTDLRQHDAGAFQFDTTNGVVHGVGETEIEVRRIHRWRQRYQFIRIHGSLQHSVERPGFPSAGLTTEFEMLDNGDSIVELSFVNLYLGRPLVILPEFKELIRLSQKSDEIYHHNLVALTRVDLFPLIDIGKSIYLWTDSDGQRVPIGYALYTARDE